MNDHGSAVKTGKKTSSYKAGSLTLAGTVAMGTGVMIGAGIFALTGQVAELSGPLFPLAFLIAAVISGFSAYTYIKVSNKYPSAGGIAMILQKAYGPATVTGAAALMMAFSMIINESLVARTFGTYTLQLFDVGRDSILVPILAIGLIIFAFTTLLGWSFYGEKCAEYLFGVKSIMIFRIVWVLAIPVGATFQLDLAWLIADTLNALMAVPNLVALLLLSPVVFKLTKAARTEESSNKDHN